MKALVSCVVVLFMSAISHGAERELYIFTSSGKVTYYLADVDSLAFGEWVPGDSLLDRRDGQKYATVVIGTQCWIANNLNIGTRINGSASQTNNGVIEKYVYNDNDSMAAIYGGFYQWDEMMQYSTTEGVQGICPKGWHIPTDAEWTTLVNSVGGPGVAGTALKQGGLSGFQALLTGHRRTDGSLGGLGLYTFFWSSSPNDVMNAWFRWMGSGTIDVQRNNFSKTNGFCVRCLKD